MTEIRLAMEKDAQRIYEINKFAFGYDYPVEKTYSQLKHILTRDTDRIWVACCDGFVVGYIHGSDYECTYSDSLKNIMAIAIDEKYRGNGIGTLLLKALENWAIEDECVGVRLVSGMNREKAHEFYLRCGYSLRKSQKNFIKNLETEK